MKKLTLISLILLCISTLVVADTVVYEPLERRGDVYYTTSSSYTYPTDGPAYFNVPTQRTCYRTVPSGVSAGLGPFTVSAGGTTYQVYCSD